VQSQDELAQHFADVGFGGNVQVCGIRNAVVTRDISPFSVAVGNPARIVKMFDPEPGSWVSIKTPDDQQKVIENRQRIGMPSREEYAKILSATEMKPIDPVVGGCGRHVF